ncbi:MAG: extracellular solute-binding protein [Lachnospiraceae bacterium]
MGSVSEKETPGNVEISEDQNITLEIYAWQDEKDRLNLLADEYMKAHSGIKIHTNTIPDGERVQTMQLAKSRDEQIDCLFAPNVEEVKLLQDNGLVRDIESEIEASGLGEAFSDWYDSSGESVRRCAVPYSMSRWAVFYNKKIFDARGIAYPEGDWTWQEYEDIAVALTDTQTEEKVYGSLSYRPDSNWWRVPARTRGANDPMNAEDLEKIKESVEWCYHLTYDLGAQQPYTEQMGNMEYSYAGKFLEGNVGMIFCGNWLIQMLNEEIEAEDLDFEYDIAPMPGWEEEEQYVIQDTAIAMISSFTEYEKEAFDFIQFVAGEEGAAILAENQILPALKSDTIQGVYKSSITMPEHIENLYQKGKISTIPSNPLYADAMGICRDEVQKYLIQEQSLEQTFEQIEEQIEMLRKENGI